MLFFSFREALRIDRQATIRRNRGGQVKHKAIGLMQVKDRFAGQDRAAILADLLDELVELRQAAFDRGEEGRLLVADRVDDAEFGLGEFGVRDLHRLDDVGNQLVQERFLLAEQIAF